MVSTLAFVFGTMFSLLQFKMCLQKNKEKLWRMENGEYTLTRVLNTIVAKQNIQYTSFRIVHADTRSFIHHNRW